MDAAAEKAAMMGFVWINGRPTSAKTISSSGGKIHFRVGALTWGTSGTTVRVGIQDVSTSAGPTAEPDGTFDVHDDLVQGTDSLSANTWTTATMSSGTKNITHGQLIAIVWDMTTRNGSDSVVINAAAAFTAHAMPVCRAFTTSWVPAATVLPTAVIEFDDGTLGYILGGVPGAQTTNSENWSDSTDPDERGIMFRVPVACTCEGVLLHFNSGGASGDATIKLWRDPTGSPSLLTSVDTLGEQVVASLRPYSVMFGTPAYLVPGVDYGLTVRATGSGNLNNSVTLGSASYMALYSGGQTLAKITRNNDSGAFASDTSTFFAWSLLLSSIDIGPSPISQIGL